MSFHLILEENILIEYLNLCYLNKKEERKSYGEGLFSIVSLNVQRYFLGEK